MQVKTTSDGGAAQAALLCVLGLAIAGGCTHAHAPRGTSSDAEIGNRRVRSVTPRGDDTVAVGYGGLGAQSRRNVTGAVGSVVLPRDRGARVTRVEELLLGRVPGVEVHHLANGELAVRIRGATGGLGGGAPLIVVDGMPLPPGSSLRAINPDDVARIDLLKDWGTAAVYGAQGANGVIVITTRRSVR